MEIVSGPGETVGMIEFRSRAVRSLVELHERELSAFIATRQRLAQSGKAMPERLSGSR